MNGPDILASLREELVSKVHEYSPPIPKPMPGSPWLAMSVLQKAIRRGQTAIAMQAAATLLLDAPERLWRRLAVIAFEDVGWPAIGTLGLVTVALEGKRFRARRLGGEWQTAAFIVERLAAAPKNRGADDLLMLVERHPSLNQERREFAHLTHDQLVRRAVGRAPLPERALAAWYALGTDRCPSAYLRTRSGDPRTVFDALCEGDFPHSIVEIGREAFRKQSHPLFCYLALLAGVRPHPPAEIVDDDFPPEVMFGPVPSWSLDVYTREGRRSLALLLSQRCETARWIIEHIPPAKRVEFVGGIAFNVEGGLLKDRYRWAVTEELRLRVEVEAQGPYCPDATEINALMRSELSLLNEARAHVL